MNKFKILTTKNFEKELENLLHYISFFLKETFISKKIYNDILFQISTLSTFPYRNPKYHLGNSKLRKLLFSNYVIIYEINDSQKEIYILHIFHKKQHYLNK